MLRPETPMDEDMSPRSWFGVSGACVGVSWVRNRWFVGRIGGVVGRHGWYWSQPFRRDQ